tara:strand:+ start:7452 stop:7694 length:243 start_codon:yes stop_codon:yes gene_type:complete
MEIQNPKNTSYSLSHKNYYQNEGRYKSKIMSMTKKFNIDNKKYMTCKTNEELIERIKKDYPLDVLINNILNYEMTYKRKC